MASGFKSDAQGFLVGEIVKNGRDLMRLQSQSISLWKGIRSDLKAIRHAVGAEVSANIRMNRTSAPQRAQSFGQRAVVARPAGRSVAVQRSAGAGARAAVVVAQPRGTNGRFVAGQRPASGGASVSGGAGSSAYTRRMNDVLSRLSSSLQATDRVDPALDAVKELRAVVSPLGRGFFSLFGRTAERKKENWYRRILKALTPGKKSDQQQGGRSGGGLLGGIGEMFGGFGGILKKVPGLLMTLFTRILGPVALLWGSWELGKWIGGKIYEWLDSSGWNAKLFDAIDAISGAFSSAWDGITKGIDTVVNGIGGAWKSITDDFKKALDGFMGFPERVEEFFSGLDVAMRKLPVIGEAYGAAADALKKTATDLKAGFSEGVSGPKSQEVLDASGRNINDPRRVDAGNAVNSDGRQVADPRRVDAPGGAYAPPASAAQAIGRDAGKVVRTVSDAGSAVAGKVGAMVGKAADRWNGGAKDDLTSASVAAGVDPGIVAKIARFESGFDSNAMPIKKDGTKISSAHGYGQFLDGTWTDMVNKHGAKYGVENAGNLTKAQANALRGDTKLQASMLAEFTKENIAKGRKYGGADDDANVYAMHNLGEGDAKKLLGAMKENPNAPVSSILSGKVIAGNKSLYGDGSITASEAYKRMGNYMRDGDPYAADARSRVVVNGPTLPSLPTATTNIPSSVPTTIPKPAEVREPPTALNSGAGAGRGSINVTVPETIGQNVGDRNTAHIVSGGLGM